MDLQQQFQQYLNQYHPMEATMETHGWTGWYVERGNGDTRICLEEKTYEEAVRVAEKKNAEETA